MLENKYKQITISEHISLYDKIIPKYNFLRKLKENIDFSFVNKLVEHEYSEQYGRPAKEPEMMYKLLFLEIKDMLSDRGNHSWAVLLFLLACNVFQNILCRLAKA